MLHDFEVDNCDDDISHSKAVNVLNGSVIATRRVKIHPSSTYRRTEKFYQMMRLIFSRIRHIVVMLLTRVTSKGWLSTNHWVIQAVVGFIIALFLLVLIYVIFFVVVRKIIWVYQHSECYTRERLTVWQEGKSHNMTRQCPLITQYRTMLETKNPLSNMDRSKICITTLSDTKKRKNTFRCRNFDEVAKFTWPNHYAYGTKHGYTVVDQSVLLDNTRPPAWSKIRAVQAMFTSFKCEWVLWLDADTVFMNSSIPLESIIPNQDWSGNQMIDLIVTTDRRFTANSGAWLIRNSEWSHQFLKDWWNLKSYVRPSGLSLSGDNDAFGYMVRQHLKINGDSAKIDAIQSEVESPSSSQHIRMIPRCTMNSFGVFVASKGPTTDPSDLTTDVTKEDWYINPDQWYYSGDFIAHASGIDQKDVGIKMLLSHAT